MKFRYVKLPFSRAQELGLTKNRNRDKNGNVIVNQSDLLMIGEPSETLDEKVARLGGTLLTHAEALKSIQKQ